MQAALLDPAQASDVIKELSAELPAALFERLGLLPGGTRHLLKPADFLEGGKVDRQRGLGQGTPSSGVWLGPQLEAVQRPIASKPHSRVPTRDGTMYYLSDLNIIFILNLVLLVRRAWSGATAVPHAPNMLGW